MVWKAFQFEAGSKWLCFKRYHRAFEIEWKFIFVLPANKKLFICNNRIFSEIPHTCFIFLNKYSFESLITWITWINQVDNCHDDSKQEQKYYSVENFENRNFNSWHFSTPINGPFDAALCLFPTGSQGLIHFIILSSFSFSPRKLLFWYLFMAIWSIFRSFFFSYSFFSDLLNNKSHTKNQCDKRMKRRRVLICFMIPPAYCIVRIFSFLSVILSRSFRLMQKHKQLFVCPRNFPYVICCWEWGRLDALLLMIS